MHDIIFINNSLSSDLIIFSFICVTGERLRLEQQTLKASHMENIQIILVALVILIIMGFLFYRILKGYVKEEFGKKWLTVWGNKLYFWQSLVFMSMAGTVLTLYLLKWVGVLNF